jgi:hypothetical protein
MEPPKHATWLGSPNLPDPPGWVSVAGELRNPLNINSDVYNSLGPTQNRWLGCKVQYVLECFEGP